MVTPFPLEKSFFDVCPTDFFDQVYNMCDDIIATAMDALEEQLSAEFKNEKDQIRQGLNKMHTKIQACFDTNIDKFEMYAVCNIFHVPPTVYGAWCAKQLAQRASTAHGADNKSSDVSLAIASGTFAGSASEADMLVADEELRSARKQLRSARRKQAARCGARSARCRMQRARVHKTLSDKAIVSANDCPCNLKPNHAPHS